jgi:hypothetical protein
MIIKPKTLSGKLRCRLCHGAKTIDGRRDIDIGYAIKASFVFIKMANCFATLSIVFILKITGLPNENVF